MFEVANRRTKSRTALQLAELIFFWTVRKISGKSRNPMISLLLNLVQSVAMIGAFFAMMSFLGMRRQSPIRADMMMFLMSGIMLFMTHNKAVGDVFAAEGPNSPMMQHAPMNTAVAILSAAFASLYLSFCSMMALLGFYHLFTHKLAIQDPVTAAGMFVLAWWTGVCVGLFFRAIRLFNPGAAMIIMMVYQRANMIFSGKMTPANVLPMSMLVMFEWNPLFHVIDGMRDAVFLNYTAHRTSIFYSFYITAGLFVIGLLADFYSRQSMHISNKK